MEVLKRHIYKNNFAHIYGFLISSQNTPILFGGTYSLNAVEWKSTLLGVILGITSFGVEIHSQNSGFNHSFESGFYYFEHGFPL